MAKMKKAPISKITLQSFLGSATALSDDLPSAAELYDLGEVADDRLVLISLPIVEQHLSKSWSSALTKSEANVTERILRGQSNREIAHSRRSSERTVANQVQTIFRKLAVASRRELIARYLEGVSSTLDETGQARTSL